MKYKPIHISLEEYLRSEQCFSDDELEYEQRMILPEELPPDYPTAKRKKKRNATE